MEERRQHPRRMHRASVFIMPYGGRCACARAAQLRNCSREGVGLKVRLRLPVGTHFLLCGHDRRRVLASYIVKRCRKLDKHYELGAQLFGFFDVPDERQLESLLTDLLAS